MMYSTHFKKRIKKESIQNSTSQKIFDLEKLVFYSYLLACLGGDIWDRHALLSSGYGRVGVWID